MTSGLAEARGRVHRRFAACPRRCSPISTTTRASTSSSRSTDGELFAWDRNGMPLAGLPGHLPDRRQRRRRPSRTPAVGDIDGDGHARDRVRGRDRASVHAYNHDGTLAAGFPIQTAGRGAGDPGPVGHRSGQPDRGRGRVLRRERLRLGHAGQLQSDSICRGRSSATTRATPAASRPRCSRWGLRTTGDRRRSWTARPSTGRTRIRSIRRPRSPSTCRERRTARGRSPSTIFDVCRPAVRRLVDGPVATGRQIGHSGTAGRRTAGGARQGSTSPTSRSPTSAPPRS